MQHQDHRDRLRTGVDNFIAKANFHWALISG
jgi:hypothetical protein